MPEPLVKINAGFVPYSDGSGYAVTVIVKQDDETSAPTISIESVGGFDASHWADIRTGIDRLLAALPT